MNEAINSFIIKLLADWLIIPIVLLGAYALLRYVKKADRYGIYSRLLLFGLTAFFIGKLMGLLYQPESLRPFVAAGVGPGALYLDNPGFPSDHTLLVFTITLAVWVGTKQKAFAGTLLLLSMAVGIGRVLALVHTPADVMGGIFAVGLAGLLWYGRDLFKSKLSKY